MLAVERLSKSFGGNVALREVSFALRRGELTSVIGPNGAGKTTLLDGISGLILVDSGKVLVEGIDLSSTAPWVRSTRWIERTFQRMKLTASLTAEDNVMLHVRRQAGASAAVAVFRRHRWRSQERDLRVQAQLMLGRFDLAAHAAAPAGQLSFGQRKLVSFAGALASSLPILLLDEPFTGLDPGRIEKVSRWLLGLAKTGTTVLFVEHNLGVVSTIADRVLALDRGSLIADGPAEAVLRSNELRAAYMR
jgi:branched-chain amino acid transport system ATP-binding protein